MEGQAWVDPWKWAIKVMVYATETGKICGSEAAGEAGAKHEVFVCLDEEHRFVVVIAVF